MDETESLEIDLGDEEHDDEDGADAPHAAR